MINKESRSAIRVKKHMRVRNRLAGTTERPRLAVFRSNNHMYAQIIDDSVGKTLVAASTTEKAIKDIYDRGGFVYHGKVQALADAAREAGLEF